MAVELFLKGKIKFLDIAELVEAATNAQKMKKDFTLDDVFEADRLAREFVLASI